MAGTVGRMARSARILGAMTAAAAFTAGCADDAPPRPETLLELPDAAPGEIVGLVANESDGTIEWIHRTDGTIHALRLDDGRADGDPAQIAMIDVATEGAQRGLLGQVLIDQRRFAAWTEPERLDLVVGEVRHNEPARIIWSAGESGSGAIGGTLARLDGKILIGVGRNTAFDAETDTDGAILSLDADRTDGQDPGVISDGYTNPWAFAVVRSPEGATEIWVADNAAGSDPADADTDDLERIGRADLVADRQNMTRTGTPDRAPSSMIGLPDGRLGICGFLDDEMLGYEIVDGDDIDPPNPATVELARSEVVRTDVVMPCLTSAAVFDDGTMVTVALGDPGLRLVILRP